MRNLSRTAIVGLGALTFLSGHDESLNELTLPKPPCSSAVEPAVPEIDFPLAPRRANGHASSHSTSAVAAYSVPGNTQRAEAFLQTLGFDKDYTPSRAFERGVFAELGFTVPRHEDLAKMLLDLDTATRFERAAGRILFELYFSQVSKDNLADAVRRLLIRDTDAARRMFDSIDIGKATTASGLMRAEWNSTDQHICEVFGTIRRDCGVLPFSYRRISEERAELTIVGQAEDITFELPFDSWDRSTIEADAFHGLLSASELWRHETQYQDKLLIQERNLLLRLETVLQDEARFQDFYRALTQIESSADVIRIAVAIER